MEQFTASEVRNWERAYKGTGAAEVFDAFADILEAREKAVPVMVVNHVSSAEHDLPIGMKLYAHPVPSDAERLAEALRVFDGSFLKELAGLVSFPEDDRGCINRSFVMERVVGLRRCWDKLSATRASSAQAQPPAARVPDAMAVFEVVSGVEGPCLTISRKADGKPRHEYRLAGPKPWGGGNTTHSFKVHTRELREQIDAIEAALAVQESPNGV